MAKGSGGNRINRNVGGVNVRSFKSTNLSTNKKFTRYQLSYKPPGSKVSFGTQTTNKKQLGKLIRDLKKNPKKYGAEFNF